MSYIIVHIKSFDLSLAISITRGPECWKETPLKVTFKSLFHDLDMIYVLLSSILIAQDHLCALKNKYFIFLEDFIYLG